MIATYFDHLMFISRASSVGEKLLSAGSLADFFAPSVLFFYIVHLFSDKLNWFRPYHLAWNCFPSRITSSKLASTYPIYLGGTLLTAFRPLIFLCQPSWAQNHNYVTHVEQSMMRSHFRLQQLICWCLSTLYRLRRHPYTVLSMTNWFSWSVSRTTQTRPSSKKTLMTACFFSSMIELRCCGIT